MTDKAKQPTWQTEFKFNSPEKLGELRRFERHYRDVAILLNAMGETPVTITGTLGNSTMYLCAAIDSGFIKSPSAKRQGDVYIIGDIDVLDGDVNDYAKIIWYGQQVASAMKAITAVPFG